MSEIEAKHIWWGIIIILSLIIICGTIIYVQEHSWIIRFEMDNNTLEAIKSINYTQMNKPYEEYINSDKGHIIPHDGIWFNGMLCFNESIGVICPT